MRLGLRRVSLMVLLRVVLLLLLSANLGRWRSRLVLVRVWMILCFLSLLFLLMFLPMIDTAK